MDNTETGSEMIVQPRRWQKCNFVSRDRLCGQRHGLAMNWVDRPRTSADERDVVWALRCRECVWAVAGFDCFSLTFRFFMNSHLNHSRAWIPACSLTAVLLHRCFSSNLSTTTQGAIVKLHGACSELCTLFICSV